MRIAIVAPYPAARGEEAHAAEIKRRESTIGLLLTNRGHEVLAVKTTRGRQPVVVHTDTGISWHFHPVLDTGERSHHLTSPALLSHIREWSPDFVFFKGAGTLLERDVLSIYSGPVGVIVGGRYRTSTLVDADLVLTENSRQDRYLARRLGRARLMRLPKFVHDDFFAQATASAKARPTDVLAVGKFEPHKNYEALAPLFDYDLSITLVGQGSLQGNIQSLAEGRKARVWLPGEVPHAEVLKLMQSAKVLAHPSLSEGFPRAVAEAMAAGVPPVGFRNVVGSSVTSGVNGLLVEREEQLVPAILQLLTNDKLRRACASGAHQTAQENFSLSALSDSVAQIDERLRQLVSHRGRTHQSRRSSRLRRHLWDASSRVAQVRKVTRRLRATALLAF